MSLFAYMMIDLRLKLISYCLRPFKNEVLLVDND